MAPERGAAKSARRFSPRGARGGDAPPVLLLFRNPALDRGAARRRRGVPAHRGADASHRPSHLTVTRAIAKGTPIQSSRRLDSRRTRPDVESAVSDIRDGTYDKKRAIPKAGVIYVGATHVFARPRFRVLGRTRRGEPRPSSRDGPPDLRERAGGGGRGARIGVPRGDAPGCDRIAEGAGVHVLPRERRARPENVHVLRGVRRRRRGGVPQEHQALRGVGRVPKRRRHRAPTQHRVRGGVLDRPGHDARIRGARLERDVARRGRRLSRLLARRARQRELRFRVQGGGSEARDAHAGARGFRPPARFEGRSDPPGDALQLWSAGRAAHKESFPAPDFAQQQFAHHQQVRRAGGRRRGFDFASRLRAASFGDAGDVSPDAPGQLRRLRAETGRPGTKASFRRTRSPSSPPRTWRRTSTACL